MIYDSSTKWYCKCKAKSVLPSLMHAYITIKKMFSLQWTKWHFSVSCVISNVHIFIVLELRQRGRFAGFSLFVSNDGNINGSFLCYKDSTSFPTLNFTTNCIFSGRYVIFYNERLDGVTYPAEYEVSGSILMELCEVNVNGK